MPQVHLLRSCIEGLADGNNKGAGKEAQSLSRSRCLSGNLDGPTHRGLRAGRTDFFNNVMGTGPKLKGLTHGL